MVSTQSCKIFSVSGTRHTADRLNTLLQLAACFLVPGATTVNKGGTAHINSWITRGNFQKEDRTVCFSMFRPKQQLFPLRKSPLRASSSLQPCTALQSHFSSRVAGPTAEVFTAFSLLRGEVQ